MTKANLISITNIIHTWMNSIHKDVQDDVGNNDGIDDDDNDVKHNANNYVKHVIHHKN
jgi:hypothetical protein